MLSHMVHSTVVSTRSPVSLRFLQDHVEWSYLKDEWRLTLANSLQAMRSFPGRARQAPEVVIWHLTCLTGYHHRLIIVRGGDSWCVLHKHSMYGVHWSTSFPLARRPKWCRLPRGVFAHLQWQKSDEKLYVNQVWALSTVCRYCCPVHWVLFPSVWVGGMMLS